ncbi:MAG: hypothetical protein ABJB11_15880 [Ferruginibacter sp.]
MRKILITLGLIVPTISAFCQQDSLLKTFKYRIDTYRAISLGSYAASNYSNIERAVDTQKNSVISAGIGVTYYTTKSTDRILLTSNNSLSVGYSHGKSDDLTNINRYKSFELMPSSSILNKWYSKKYFTELGANISGNYYNYNSKLSNQPVSGRQKNGFYSLAINTGIGQGRLENITDMQNALWLNKVLTEVNSLSRTLTPAELNGLGRSITKGNNTRVLDSRKRIQFILKTVDDYLQQQGLIKKTDIDYFSNLNDILFFAINNPRLAGTEKYLRFTPAIALDKRDYKYSNDINKFKHRRNTQSFVLTSGISKYVPISLTHQNNYGANIKLSYLHSDLSDKYLTNDVVTDEMKTKSEMKQAGVQAFYEHAIYPNTRTTINVNLNAESGYQNFVVNNNFYAIVNLTATANYFISYRTRFTCSLGMQYIKNDYTVYQYPYQRPNGINLSANAGIEINL